VHGLESVLDNYYSTNGEKISENKQDPGFAPLPVKTFEEDNNKESNKSTPSSKCTWSSMLLLCINFCKFSENRQFFYPENWSKSPKVDKNGRKNDQLIAANTIAMSFSITGGTPAQGSVVGEASCITDWITILCATNTMNQVWTFSNFTYWPYILVKRDFLHTKL
jgi:hypothetical protein